MAPVGAIVVNRWKWQLRPVRVVATGTDDDDNAMSDASNAPPAGRGSDRAMPTRPGVSRRHCAGCFFIKMEWCPTHTGAATGPTAAAV